MPRGVACPFQLAVMTFKVNWSGFLGGPKDKNLPDNSWGHRFDPWSGKIPHTAGQLSTTTIEPVLQGPGAATAEALAAWSPYAAARE